jgi:hypothetical protein
MADLHHTGQSTCGEVALPAPTNSR